jgi:starch synthase
MRILFATAEVAPIAKTGGLGDVCGSLPKALRRLGHDIVMFMPLYRQAREWFAQYGVEPEEAIAPTQITWANWSAQATVWRTELPESDIPLYLVANEHFFSRDAIYSPRADGYDDGVERYAFFCRAVINACEILGLSFDVVHAHDWHAALLPLYLHAGLHGSDSFHGARSVFTIHNLNYQGLAPGDRFAATGLHSRYFAPDAMEHFGQVNLMKGAIITADQVTTVSPTYAREIQTPPHGAGLDGVLRSLSFKLSGILNGIDAEQWDPATDPHIASHFERGRLNGKNLSKRALLRTLNLRYKARTPLLAFVSRLVDQKGVDLLIASLPQMLRAGAQAVILGSGEARYEDALAAIVAQHPDSCRARLRFDSIFAHQIYAGADMLLVPSLYEPCGLSQMYALRYGTLPVVRLTGGLADTVVPYDGTNAEAANGFGFLRAGAADLYTATWLGMLNYREPKTWRALQDNGMAADHSWSRSAEQYDFVYRRAMAA